MGQPFKRFNLLMQQVSAVFSGLSGNNTVERVLAQQQAQQLQESYVSRGHGKGTWDGKHPLGHSSGQRYPEQSERQALRGMRRAQGGPGLDENGRPRARS